MTAAPVFPPLFHGLALSGQADPFAKAIAEALRGCDAGLVVHNVAADWLRAALVLAPEVPLREAMSALVASGLGFQNALGALAPPEVAVHLAWDGGIAVNGAACGRLRAAASHDSPDATPDWLVIGLEIPLIPQEDSDPSTAPERTCLMEEGCADVDPVMLLEAWVRHTLVWLNRLEEEGPRRLHEDWRGLCREIGEEVRVTVGGEPREGVFLGVDEHFGMLLRGGEETHVVPLTALLESGG